MPCELGEGTGLKCVNGKVGREIARAGQFLGAVEGVGAVEELEEERCCFLA